MIPKNVLGPIVGSAIMLCLAARTIAAPCEPLDGEIFQRAPHTVVYDWKPSEPGDLVQLGGVNYRIVRVPFVEFKTGDQYAITYPLLQEDNRFVTELQTKHFKATDCSDVHVTGKSDTKKKLTIQELRLVNWSNGEFSILRAWRRTLRAQIGHTQLSLTMWSNYAGVGQFEVGPANIGQADYDLVDNVTFSEMTDEQDPYLDYMNELVDYVFIEKLD